MLDQVLWLHEQTYCHCQILWIRHFLCEQCISVILVWMSWYPWNLPLLNGLAYCLEKWTKSHIFWFMVASLWSWMDQTCPQCKYVNGGVSVSLSIGKSAIFCVLNFPWGLWEITQWYMMLMHILCPWITQNPDCWNWFKMSPLRPCATALRHHWTTVFVISFFLGSNTGCTLSLFSLDFPSLPPTLNSLNGSTWYKLLDFGRLMSFVDIDASISEWNDWYWTILMM